MERLVIIKDRYGVQDLIEYLKDKDIIAFDTETTGVTEESEVIGYSICAEPDVGYYVVCSYWNVFNQQLTYLGTKEDSVKLFESLKGKRLVGHNGTFDCAMIARNFGVELIESLFCDTMILAHLVDENRRVGLKDLGAKFYGDDAKAEQVAMKESVTKNGGVLTKDLYELYKGDCDLIAKYGAKDALLTYNLLHELLPQLYEDKLDAFFFDDESMPLLRGPTYDLNTTGLKVDMDKLAELKRTLEVEILELKAFIYDETHNDVKDLYPGNKPKDTFNLNSNAQLSWLLFERLGNTFNRLSDSGKELCKTLGTKPPYTKLAKTEFITQVRGLKGDTNSGKKIRDYWTYICLDKTELGKFSSKYKWVGKLLEYKKLTKLLSTYVEGIQSAARYGVIHPSFLQHGTTSGRYSSRHPNFQNLPRDDKRIKSCIVARPGKVFVGADYSQLEPRVFASVSQDPTLMACFASGEDFYSVVGAPIFEKFNCSLVKDDPGSFASKFPKLRDKSKVIALATPYGRTARQQASAMGITEEDSQELIDKYFNAYPKVLAMMLDSHKQAKDNGVVYSLYGRPRRIPEAKEIRGLYGDMPHENLPYYQRTLLNLAMNHRVQSTAASIVNRASTAFWKRCKKEGIDAKLVMQVHDELIVECNEEDGELCSLLLAEAMQNSTVLPGVALITEPKIAKSLDKLK